MSAHTPGPWTDQRAYFLDSDYGRTPVIVPVNGENPVARITNDYEDTVLFANARLIAAAPELLEALVRFNAFFGDGYVNSGAEFQQIRALARTAIAKATEAE